MPNKDRMFNIDSQWRDEGNEEPVIRPDGTIDFQKPTDDELAVLMAAKKEGIKRNAERGGSGRILSSEEKAKDWHGPRAQEGDGSEWSLDLNESDTSKGEDAKKKQGWHGPRAQEGDGSEWSLDLNEQTAAAVESIPDSAKQKERAEVLSRQIDDISQKLASVLEELIRATDESEKERLRKLADILKKGHENKSREYAAIQGLDGKREERAA